MKNGIHKGGFRAIAFARKSAIKRIVTTVLVIFVLLPSLLPVNSIAFADDTVITRQSGDESNPHKYTLSEDGTLTKYEGPGGALTIPAQVISIQDQLLRNNATITSVNFESPSLLKTVGVRAFQNCSNLASVDFTNANTLEVIGDFAFAACPLLTSVIIPNSVTNLGNGVFNSCGSLRSITIPASVKTLGTSIFTGCISLESVFFYSIM
jgi:hypothetical protein